MKKYISYIIAALMVLPMSMVYGLSATNIQDSAVPDNFSLSHAVSRLSTFETTVLNTKIDEAGETKIGKFSIKNNTRDGFTVYIQSAEGGVLSPSSTDDGESDIGYNVAISKDGDLGIGVDFIGTIASSALAANAAVTVLHNSGLQSSATSLKCELSVDISDNGQMEMAGTYSDTITVTYVDQ